MYILLLSLTFSTTTFAMEESDFAPSSQMLATSSELPTSSRLRRTRRRARKIMSDNQENLIIYKAGQSYKSPPDLKNVIHQLVYNKNNHIEVPVKCPQCSITK